MKNKPKISIVLGSYNRKNYLKLTIESIRKELKGFSEGYEILVIDGGSTDGSIKWLTKQKDVITIVQHNRGIWKGNRIVRRSWGYFMNIVYKATHSDYICMVSDDCLIVPGAIRNGYELLDKKINDGEKIGAVAFYWRDWPRNDNKYWIGTQYGKPFLNHGFFYKKALEEVNFIDEDNYMFYHADSDLCLRLIQDGWKIIDSKTSFIEHFHEAAINVRATNNAAEKKDNNFFNSRWDKVFNTERKSDDLILFHDDTTRTGKQFMKAYVFDYKSFLFILIQFIKKCIGKAFKILKIVKN